MIGVSMRLAMIGLMIAAASPARAAPPIEVYGRLPANTDMRLSPSGERIAFIGSDGEKRRLYVVTTEGKTLAMANVGAAKVRNVQWAGNDHVMVTTSATVAVGPAFAVIRHEWETVIVADVVTGKSFQVFGEAHSQRVVNAVFGSYGTAEVGGHWYGWFGGITYADSGVPVLGRGYLSHGYPDLYKVDLDTGRIEIAALGREDSDEWVVGLTGEVVARSLYDTKFGD